MVVVLGTVPVGEWNTISEVDWRRGVDDELGSKGRLFGTIVASESNEWGVTSVKFKYDVVEEFDEVELVGEDIFRDVFGTLLFWPCVSMKGVLDGLKIVCFSVGFVTTLVEVVVVEIDVVVPVGAFAVLKIGWRFLNSFSIKESFISIASLLLEINSGLWELVALVVRGI